MSLAVTADQVAFAEAVTSWAADREVRSLTRQVLNFAVPDIDHHWKEVADLGWSGLLVPETLGGGGATWEDAAVLLEALAAECSPLPLAATLAVTSVLAGVDADEARGLLRGAADGSVRFGLYLGSSDAWVVAAGATATHVAVLGGPDRTDVEIHDVATCDRTPGMVLDPASGACELTHVGSDAVLTVPGAAQELRNATRVLFAAEAVGVSFGALKLAVDHAGVREAFGRVIGSFQAVKHHCANMLLAAQLASAATWRAAAARGGADEATLADGAAYLAATSALTCAKTSLQVMGGIGYTWEHDVHLFLRRAGLLQSVVGPIDELASAAGRSRIADARPSTTIALPPEADALREKVADFRDSVLAAAPEDRHAMVVDQGFLHPEWPAPWGRGSGPLEQLVIEETLSGVDRRSALGATYWEVPIILPTVLEWGTEDQVERWMRPSMMGEIKWCQLFSEPSAGSDLAALRTRAVKVAGGWRVTGQKVWTSDAHHADRGMALVRTNPDEPKHAGISCLMIDLRTPGVEIRPLVQITGEAHFNEVFLDDVFVPDEDVLGPVDSGWKVTRSTLANERVSLGASSSLWTSGPVWEQIVALTAAAADSRPDLVRQLGQIVFKEEGAAALRLRSASRALLGRPAGIDGTIGKTVVADLAQQVGDFCMEAGGERIAFYGGADVGPSAMFLAVRMATIAGGTSEILRNLLAERALGMPREPESA